MTVVDQTGKKNRVAWILLLFFLALNSSCGGGGSSSSMEDRPPGNLPSVNIPPVNPLPGVEPALGGVPPPAGDTAVLQKMGNRPRMGICSKGRSPAREERRRRQGRTVVKGCGPIDLFNIAGNSSFDKTPALSL